MSLGASDPAGIVAAGITIAVVLGGGVFKTASLRGDTHEKWSSRVQLATFDLDGKLATALRSLSEQTREALPPPDAPFDPANALVDPGPFANLVQDMARFYKARVRLGTTLARLLRLGPSYLVFLTLGLFADAVLTVRFAEFLTWGWMKPVGFISAGIALVGLVVTTALYAFWMHRLASGAILAGPGSPDSGEKTIP